MKSMDLNHNSHDPVTLVGTWILFIATMAINYVTAHMTTIYHPLVEFTLALAGKGLTVVGLYFMYVIHSKKIESDARRRWNKGFWIMRKFLSRFKRK